MPGSADRPREPVSSPRRRPTDPWTCLRAPPYPWPLPCGGSSSPRSRSPPWCPSAALAQAPAGHRWRRARAGARAARRRAGGRAARPVVDAITCRTGCLGIARATPGSVVRISGEGMATVASVILLGRRGYRDDVTVPPRRCRRRRSRPRVPASAHGGLGARRLRHGPAIAALADAARHPPDGHARPGRPGGRGQGADAQAALRGRPHGDRGLLRPRRRAGRRRRRRGARERPRGRRPLRRAGHRPRQRAERRLGRHDRRRRAARRPLRLPGGGRDRGRRRRARGAGGRAGARAARASGSSTTSSRSPGRTPTAQGFGAQRSGHVHEGQDVMADCGLPARWRRGPAR